MITLKGACTGLPFYIQQAMGSDKCGFYLYVKQGCEAVEATISYVVPVEAGGLLGKKWMKRLEDGMELLVSGDYRWDGAISGVSVGTFIASSIEQIA